MSEKAVTDELYGKAIEIIMSAEKYSVSLLQRKLGLGYSDASKLMDYIACKHIAEIKRLRAALKAHNIYIVDDCPGADGECSNKNCWQGYAWCEHGNEFDGSCMKPRKEKK